MNIVAIAREFIGVKELSTAHRGIVDTYNQLDPLPRGYKVQYDDPWCDVFVSYCIKKAGLIEELGVECGCPSHVAFLKEHNRWTTGKPSSGDLVFFSSNGKVPSHVGIVETVSGKSITTIEGNSMGRVRRNHYHLNDKYIFGYGINPESSGVSTSGKTGFVNVDALNVRTWAGTEYDTIISIPMIYEGQVVEIVNTIKDTKGNPWHYVKIPYRYNEFKYGFVFAEYITTN